MERERFALTLYDYRDQLHWVGQMGWKDDDLRRVPVYEQATSGEDYLNLANFGGTALGVSERSGGGTSASSHSIHNIYVYRRTTPPELYRRLEKLMKLGGTSGYEDGVFGESGEASDFPPR
jgi:hypothetical protein